MLIRKGYKFRLKVNKSTEVKLLDIARSCRCVWNTALRMNLSRLKNRNHRHYKDTVTNKIQWCDPSINNGIMWFFEMSKFLTFQKKTEEKKFLRDAPSCALEAQLRRQERSFKEAFNPKMPTRKVPIFKKQSDKQSFTYRSGFKIIGNKLYLSKVEQPIPIILDREIIGKQKNVTISRYAGHWYASVQVEQEVPEPIHPSTQQVGIDVGIKQFVTCSDGTVYLPRSPLAKYQEKLAKIQKKMCKLQRCRKKFNPDKKLSECKNYQKVVLQYQKIHEKIANIRKDFTHKVSKSITDKYSIIKIEDLNLSGMTKSAKGTIEKPGKCVAAKSGLNRNILDQGLGELTRQLEYKSMWKGGTVVKVNPRYTSQKCHMCGHVDSANRKTQEEFICVSCGHEAHADINAALNISIMSANEVVKRTCKSSMAAS